MNYIVETIRDVNPHRTIGNVERRFIKVLEELGEASEAYLSVSSPHNYKSKTWLDFREESIDTMIVLIDIALTDIGGGVNIGYMEGAFELGRSHHHPRAHATLARNFHMISKNVGLAWVAFLDCNHRAFRTAICNAMVAAVELCYTPILEDQDREEIIVRTRETFDTKIAKWNAGMRQYAATDSGK